MSMAVTVAVCAAEIVSAAKVVSVAKGMTADSRSSVVGAVVGTIHQWASHCHHSHFNLRRRPRAPRR